MIRSRTASVGASRRRGLISEPVNDAHDAAPSRQVAPQRALTRRLITVGSATVLAVALAACGSSSNGGAKSTSGSGSQASGSQASGSAANVAAAKAAIAPYTGKVSPFPVTTPLSSKLPAGKKFAFLQCGTPFCALAGKSLQGAVVAIGGKFTKINAGSTASSSQAAASSILALKPDAVFVTVDPALYGNSLRKLTDAGIKVLSISIVKDVKPFGLTFNYLGAAEVKQDGKILADWVIARLGAKADAVFYGLPTFDFSGPLQQSFKDEMAKNCPKCKVRTVAVDVATIGTTSARTVVADLQAHRSTNVAVFSSLQIAAGLPAALKSAGLKVTTIGRAATPANLQDIKTGGLTASLAIDQAVSTWTLVDSAARLIMGDQPTPSEQAGNLDEQLLEQKDITFDPSNGWTGYPDFPQRFAKLWHTAS